MISDRALLMLIDALLAVTLTLYRHCPARVLPNSRNAIVVLRHKPVSLPCRFIARKQCSLMSLGSDVQGVKTLDNHANQ